MTTVVRPLCGARFSSGVLDDNPCAATSSGKRISGILASAFLFGAQKALLGESVYLFREPKEHQFPQTSFVDILLFLDSVHGLDIDHGLERIPNQRLKGAGI